MCEKKSLVAQDETPETEIGFTSAEGNLTRVKLRVAAENWGAWAGWKDTGSTLLGVRAGPLLVAPLRIGSEQADRLTFSVNTNAGQGSVGVALGWNWPWTVWINQTGTSVNTGIQVHITQPSWGWGLSGSREAELGVNPGPNGRWVDNVRGGGKWGGKLLWSDISMDLTRTQSGMVGKTGRMRLGGRQGFWSWDGAVDRLESEDGSEASLAGLAEAKWKPFSWWSGQTRWKNDEANPKGAWSVENTLGQDWKFLSGMTMVPDSRPWCGAFQLGITAPGSWKPSFEASSERSGSSQSLGAQGAITIPERSIPGDLRLKCQVDRKASPSTETTNWRLEAIWSGPSGVEASLVWTRESAKIDDPLPIEIYGSESKLALKVSLVW